MKKTISLMLAICIFTLSFKSFFVIKSSANVVDDVLGFANSVVTEISRAAASAFFHAAYKVEQLVSIPFEAQKIIELVASGEYNYLDFIDSVNSMRPFDIDLTDDKIKVTMNESFTPTSELEGMIYDCVMNSINAVVDVGYLTADMIQNQFLTYNEYKNILDTAYNEAVSTLHISSSGGAHGGDGRRRYEVGEESFTINGTKVTMKDFPVDMESIHRTDAYTNVVPCFKYNETLYILGGEYSFGEKYANGIMLAAGPYLDMFWVVSRNGFLVGNGPTLYLKGYSTIFNAIIEGDTINLKNNDNKFNFKMGDSFINFETKEFVAIESLGLTKSQVKDRLKVLVYYQNKSETNLLLSTSTITEKKEKNTIEIPSTDNENILNTGLENGDVTEDTPIYFDDDGIKKVGDLTLDEFMVLLGLKEPSDPDDPTPPEEPYQPSGDFIKDLLEGIKRLFIPDKHYFDNVFKKLEAKFKSKLPFAFQLTDLISSIFEDISNDTQKPKIEIELYGKKMEVIDFTAFETVKGYVHGFILFTSYFFYINRTRKRLPSIIRGI